MKFASPSPEPVGAADFVRTPAELQADPEFQRALAQDHRDERLRTGKVACWLVILLMPLGALPDWLIYRDYVEILFGLRLTCSALVGGLLALHFTEVGRRNIHWLGAPIALLPALFLAIMIATPIKNGGFDSPYYAALNLLLLAISVVVHWDVRESVFATAAILIFYLLAGWQHPSNFVPHLHFINFYFLALTGVIVACGNYFFNQLRLREFASRYELERSRGLLEQSFTRLRELDELKGRFFANISHELRTPLTLLIAPIDVLRSHEAVTRDPRLRQNLETMHANGLRLLKLINDLLDLVRLDAGRLRLNPVAVDMESFLQGLRVSVRQYAQDRGLQVVCEVDPDVPRISADPDKLEKVFLNLLFNSIKFTPAGGRVTVRARREGGHVSIEVSDSGVGVSPEQLPHLFERFWQADTSAHRKYQGAGIGLALVKELVELHGGTIEARSELNHGTTMTVRMPLRDLPDALPPVATETTPSTGAEANLVGADSVDRHEVSAMLDPMVEALYHRAELHASINSLRENLRPWVPTRGGSRPRLLLVDDEPDMLRFLTSQLEDDYEVLQAVDGDQATSMAKQYLPAVVVCDMMLPEKDGLEVCRELRANHGTRGVAFLMLTARADEETKLSALTAGASDFLPKPFSTAELRLRVKNLADAHQLQKELSSQNQKLEATIEELKETELQLVQSEKMASLGRMSAGIIHEINNPLNYARTGLHMIGRYAQKLPDSVRTECEDTLRDINEGITRVATIVTDLRSFSHPQGGELGPVDLGEAVQAALRFLAGEWKDERVDLQNELPAGFLVPAVRTKLVQIFVNLLQNSFDAMRSHPPAEGRPTLRIQTRSEGGRRLVTFWDNGPGIPAAHLPRIFDPFFTTKDVGQGTGLGLSICYRILGEFGARIAVRSEEGRFCEFTLEFPQAFADSTHRIAEHLHKPA